MSQKILVTGGGGFIGGHLIRRLRSERFWVRAVDLKRHDLVGPTVNEFIVGDLLDPNVMRDVTAGIDEVYQLAADIGGAASIFTGEHDAVVMHNSATINLNMLEFGVRAGVKRFFYSSSACLYPEHNQLDPAIRRARKRPPTRLPPDREYNWKSCSANASTRLS